MCVGRKGGQVKEGGGKGGREVRQYSGSLAHPRGMYFNGKEGMEGLSSSLPFL